MHQAIKLASAAVVAAPLAGCSFNFTEGAWEKAKTTVTQTVEHVPGSAIMIKSRNGRIEVVADPQRSDIAIEARFTCRGETQAEAQERLALTSLSVTRGQDQTLIITPVFPDEPRNGDGASISVRLPDASGATLNTSNGSVRARGLSGKLVIDTSNGPVEVSGHDGPAEIDTSNGPITVTDHTGSLFADTSNGSVKLTNVDGRVEADTSNGTISVSLAPNQPGPLILDTSNGSISVRVGAGFTGAVSFDTSNGSVSVEDHLGRVEQSSLHKDGGRIVVGEGGDRSRVDTSNGRISFTIGG